MSLKLPKAYSQLDSRWANDILGFNTDPKYNMHDYGCLVTCIAMAARYYGYQVTPGELNELLKDVDGFSNGGYYNFGYITKIYKDIKEHRTITRNLLTDEQMNDIKNALDKGFPVMIQLDYNPRTVFPEMHFVLVIGYDPLNENNLLIVDPLGGKVVSLKKYLGWWKPNARKTIEQFVIYEGTTLTDTAHLENKIAKMEKAFKALREDHEKKLANTRKECQDRRLEVKRSLEKVVKTL